MKPAQQALQPTARESLRAAAGPLASISTDNHLPKPERGFRAEAIGSRLRD